MITNKSITNIKVTKGVFNNTKDTDQPACLQLGRRVDLDRCHAAAKESSDHFTAIGNVACTKGERGLNHHPEIVHRNHHLRIPNQGSKLYDHKHQRQHKVFDL
jgi:hypothetical protein